MTQLQGDAFVTLDPDLAGRAEGVVTLAALDALRDAIDAISRSRS